MSAAMVFNAFADQDIFTYGDGVLATLESSSIRKMFLSDGLMGLHGVPQMPLFVYNAINDEVSIVSDTDELMAKYCAAGANILYQRNAVGGHLAEMTNGDARAFEWLSSVFDGTYNTTHMSSGCTIQDVTLNVTSSPL